MDCAIIGAVAGYWTSDDFTPLGENHTPLRLYTNCDNILHGLNLTENQVQVVLYKNADSGEPGAPNPPLLALPGLNQSFTGCTGQNYDPCVLARYVADAARMIKTRYHNVQQMFVHSRIYGGYATTPLNPEPYAFEQGFAMKWLIQAQTDQLNNNFGSQADLGLLTDGFNQTTASVPWIDWGAYTLLN